MTSSIAFALQNGMADNTLFFGEKNSVTLQITSPSTVTLSPSTNISLEMDGYFTEEQLKKWSFSNTDWTFTAPSNDNKTWILSPTATITLNKDTPYTIDIKIPVGSEDSTSNFAVQPSYQNIAGVGNSPASLTVALDKSNQPITFKITNGTKHNTLFYSETNNVTLNITSPETITLSSACSISLKVNGYFSEEQLKKWSFSKTDWTPVKPTNGNKTWVLNPKTEVTITANTPYPIDVDIPVTDSSAGANFEIHPSHSTITGIGFFSSPFKVFLEENTTALDLSQYMDCIFIQPTPPTDTKTKCDSSSGILPQVVTSNEANNLFTENQLSFAFTATAERPPSTIKAGSSSCFEISFLYGASQDDASAFTTVALATDTSYFKFKQYPTGWTPTLQTDSENPSWKITIPEGTPLVTEGNPTFLIDKVVTTLPPKLTQMYVQYCNIPGYEDGKFILNLQKQPQVSITSFTATPTTIQGKGTTTLSWELSSATSATLSPAETPITIPPLSGSQVVTIKKDMTFTLTAQGINPTSVTGTNTASTEVSVTLTPLIKSFTGDISFANSGDTLTLSWDTEGAYKVQGSWSASSSLKKKDSKALNAPFDPEYTISLLNSDNTVVTTSTVKLEYTQDANVSGGILSVSKGYDRLYGITVTNDGTKLLGANKSIGTQTPNGPPPISYNLKIVDISTMTVSSTTIPVGTEPRGIAITPDGTHALVTNAGDNTVSLVDIAQEKQTGTVQVGNQPEQIVITPNGSYAFVSNQMDMNISCIDLSNYQPLPTLLVPGGMPECLAVSADNHYLFVQQCGGSSGTICRFDINNLTQAPTPIYSGACNAIATTPDKKYLLATNFQKGELLVFSMSDITSKPQKISLNSAPLAVTATADSNYAIICGSFSADVIDLKTLEPASHNMVMVNAETQYIAVTPDNKHVFFSNGSSPYLAVNTLTVPKE